MSVRQELRCPVCGKLLLEGFWVASVLTIAVMCRCQRVIEILQDMSTQVLHDQPKRSGVRSH